MTPSTSEWKVLISSWCSLPGLTLQLIQELELPGHVVALQQVPGLHLPLVHHLQVEDIKYYQQIQRTERRNEIYKTLSLSNLLSRNINRVSDHLDRHWELSVDVDRTVDIPLTSLTCNTHLSPPLLATHPPYL